MALDSKLPFLVLLANSFQLVEAALLLVYPRPPNKTESEPLGAQRKSERIGEETITSWSGRGMVTAPLLWRRPTSAEEPNGAKQVCKPETIRARIDTGKQSICGASRRKLNIWQETYVLVQNTVQTPEALIPRSWLHNICNIPPWSKLCPGPTAPLRLVLCHTTQNQCFKSVLK